MNQQLISAIADGAPGLMITVSAQDLKEVFTTIYNQESERTAKAIEQRRELPTLTRGQVMKLLNISCATLHRWGKEGLLCPVKVGAKSMFRQSDIDEFLALHIKRTANK